MSSTLLVASLALAILIAIFLVLYQRKRASSANSILLVGPSDAGKTAILTTLVYDQTLPTHTSLQPNSSLITLPSSQKTLQIVDVPGHPRIRDQFRDHLPIAKAVVFVVDASTVSRNGPVVAEHLHQILHALTSLPPSQTPPRLLITAHKSDLLKATSSQPQNQLAINRVKSILERELDKRRVAQASGVGVEGLEEDASELGGLECSGGAFRFHEWEGGEVEFVGTALGVGKAGQEGEKEAEKEGGKEEKDGDGLGALREWLEELA